MFNPATVGTGTSVVKYKATPDEKYGYETNATPLWDRPAVVEQPYGSGRSVLFGFNPFYRSWKEQDERLVLNAVLYPKGGVVTERRADAGLGRARPAGGRDRAGGRARQGPVRGRRGPRAGGQGAGDRP